VIKHVHMAFLKNHTQTPMEPHSIKAGRSVRSRSLRSPFVEVSWSAIKRSWKPSLKSLRAPRPLQTWWQLRFPRLRRGSSGIFLARGGIEVSTTPKQEDPADALKTSACQKNLEGTLQQRPKHQESTLVLTNHPAEGHGLRLPDKSQAHRRQILDQQLRNKRGLHVTGQAQADRQLDDSTSRSPTSHLQNNSRRTSRETTLTTLDYCS